MQESYLGKKMAVIEGREHIRGKIADENTRKKRVGKRLSGTSEGGVRC